MQIEPATCPACSNTFNPLRARNIIVIDGRVRAFCSPACRDRGLAPAERPQPSTDAHSVMAPPTSAWWRLPSEQLVLLAVAIVALGIFVLLLRAGRQRSAAATPAAATATATAARASKPERLTASALTASEGPDEWIQPLAGSTRHTTLRERRTFPSARAGLSAEECGGGRCAVELEAAPGDIVMAVHDGVVEAVERDPDPAGRRGQEGRFVRINHKGGAVATTYMQLDGIREDLRPGIPVRVGEAIGMVGNSRRLRFAVTLDNTADNSRLFIDAQPLLVLWPTRKHASTSLHAMERAPQPQ